MEILKKIFQFERTSYILFYYPFSSIFFIVLKVKRPDFIGLETTCGEESQADQPTEISEHKEWVAREVTATEHITSVVDNTYRMLFLEMQGWRKVVRGTGSQVWDEPKTLRRAFPVPEIPSETLNIGFTSFYNGCFSVSTVVFINSFQMQISLCCPSEWSIWEKSLGQVPSYSPS